MSELAPIPFGVLAVRLFRELAQKKAAFDLPVTRFFQGAALDLSTVVHGQRAATPFGPAAGPHTQLAQNIVLSWLAGGRVIELKTVQIKDNLVIPRPCIDMQTIGFNVEWSQELTLEQSLEEYVKASMLVDMLKAAGWAPAYGDTVFDMSVGYDLAGIRSARVRAFMAGLMDATAIVARLRGQIPSSRPTARYAVRDPYFRYCHAFHLSWLPAAGDRGHRRVPPARGGAARRGQAQSDPARPRAGDGDSARAPGLSRPQRAGCRVRQGRHLGAGDGLRRPARHPGAISRPQFRRQILQHPAGRQSQELLPDEREGNVPFRPAFARAGDATSAPLPPNIRRPF